MLNPVSEYIECNSATSLLSLSVKSRGGLPARCRYHSGHSCPSTPPSCSSHHGQMNFECADTHSIGVDPKLVGGYKLWKGLTFLLGFPLIIAAAIFTYKQKTENEIKREPFTEYEYMRRRTKRFPWGDGQKSLFHNPHVNALPDGYEHESG